MMRRNVNRTRRLLLATIPGVALAATACGSKSDSSQPIGKDAGTPPKPDTPDQALQVLMDGNGVSRHALRRFAMWPRSTRCGAEVSARVSSRSRPFWAAPTAGWLSRSSSISSWATSSWSGRPATSQSRRPISAASSTPRPCWARKSLLCWAFRLRGSQRGLHRRRAGWQHRFDCRCYQARNRRCTQPRRRCCAQRRRRHRLHPEEQHTTARGREIWGFQGRRSCLRHQDRKGTPGLAPIILERFCAGIALEPVRH